jgi:hypothetical protein
MSIYTESINTQIKSFGDWLLLRSEYIPTVGDGTTQIPYEKTEAEIYHRLSTDISSFLVSNSTVASQSQSFLLASIETLIDIRLAEWDTYTSNISSKISQIPSTTKANLKFTLTSSVAGTLLGKQFTEEIEELATSMFLSDFYSFKFICREAKVLRNKAINIITSLSNLLRLCNQYGINEVFLGPIRLKKAKDKNYWILVSY